MRDDISGLIWLGMLNAIGETRSGFKRKISQCGRAEWEGMESGD